MTKKQAKLEIAAGMVSYAMNNVSPDRQVYLLCDSKYPKGCVAGFVDENHNFDIICKVIRYICEAAEICGYKKISEGRRHKAG